MTMAMISGTCYSKLITGYNLQKSAMNNSKVTSPKKLTSPSAKLFNSTRILSSPYRILCSEWTHYSCNKSNDSLSRYKKLHWSHKKLNSSIARDKSGSRKFESINRLNLGKCSNFHPIQQRKIPLISRIINHLLLISKHRANLRQPAR
jgi:hypothetical protein